MDAPQIHESSDLAVSTTHPGLVYTTNDSGGSATVYVVDSHTGQLAGHTVLSGVHAVDFEALGAGTDGFLVVGDIGDNNGTRKHITLYRIPQPGRGTSSVTPRAIRLTYPHGKHDAESLLYDQVAGRVYIITKELIGEVYATPAHVFRHGHAALGKVASAPPVATDAAFVNGGRDVVIRGYTRAWVDSFPSFHHLASFALPPQRQGESVTQAPGGGAVWVGTEGHRSKVKVVALPSLAPPPPSTTSPTGPSRPVEGAGGASGLRASDTARTTAGVILWVGGAALALLLIAMVVAWARDRRRDASA